MFFVEGLGAKEQAVVCQLSGLFPLAIMLLCKQARNAAISKQPPLAIIVLARAAKLQRVAANTGASSQRISWRLLRMRRQDTPFLVGDLDGSWANVAGEPVLVMIAANFER